MKIRIRGGGYCLFFGLSATANPPAAVEFSEDRRATVGPPAITAHGEEYALRIDLDCQRNSGRRAEAKTAREDHRPDGRDRGAGQSGVPQAGLGQDRRAGSEPLVARWDDGVGRAHRPNLWSDRWRWAPRLPRQG